MFRKKVYFLSMAIVFLLVVSFALVYYLFFTTSGSSLVVKRVLTSYLKPEKVEIQKTKGNFSETLLFENIECINLKGLPQKSAIKIQKLKASFTSFNPSGLNLEVENGRLKLADSEPILFYGSLKNSFFDLNLYARQMQLKEFLDLFIENKTPGDISGRISELDIYVKGPSLKPELTGTFLIEEFSRNGFSIDSCPASFSVSVEDLKGSPKVFGEVVLHNGTVSGPKTAIIKLQRSRILFSGNPQMPALDIKGISLVEGTKIEIVLQGTMDKPKLRLGSWPPMSEERLLFMLTTGKSWEGAEMSLSQGRVSAELVRDFLDYFVFSGSGDRIAQSLGIDSVSLQYDNQTKGFGVKKAISEKLKASYATEQRSQSEEGESTTTHQLGGEYKVTEAISVEAEKELKQDNTAQQKELPTDDKVILKYKKEF